MELSYSNIKVEIEAKAHKDMFGWCRAAKTEVSGWGLVRLVNGVFRVYKVFLPEQECSTGYTKIRSEATGRLYNSLYQKKMVEEMGDVKLWWHTHYNFGTFWSGIDDNQARENARNAGDWSLSIVVNQAGDLLARTDFVNPIDITINKLRTKIVDNSVKTYRRNYKSDIRKWVKPIQHHVNENPRQDNGVLPWYRMFRSDEPQYVNVGGSIMTLKTYLKFKDCFCGDNTCVDCLEVLKENTHGQQVLESEASY